MSDPVTLSTTARTYDRPNIRRWLAAGHRTCPVTMRRLPKSGSKEVLLVPNRTLKHLIDRWILTGRTLSISDLALPTLKDNLLAGMDDSTVMEETLRIVMLLSPPGFCALLLRLLLRHSRHDDDDDRAPAHALLVELALDCLLASPSAHELAASLQTGDVSSFAVVLRRGSLTVRTGLCRLMHIAADAMAEQQLCIMVLGRSEKIMGALAALVHDGGAASDAALRAMSSLCSSDQAIRETAVAAGAVDALLSYISYGAGHCRKWPPCSALMSRALETLEQVLVSVGSGRQAMYARYGATAVLVKMVFRVPFDQGSGSSDHAIGSLLVACRESAAVRVDAINAGLLTQLLLLLQSQRASPRAKANALALLKLLRTIWARH
ncbi:hypothetical protein QYE76_019674 [Lolium multiflorum]|uniref:U-box domain-containing protein n=1 Tax=Lolium multiflorum TaxID=4521 RepID=A0AAD8R5J1_LOLMU|nr:hypothetical protein QYE76_019674 [Lolium multiflorum]